jgi:hypothetical protein
VNGRFNGYAPGESRTMNIGITIRDPAGHAVVVATTTRLGSRMAFRYTMTCECGKQFNSRTAMVNAGYAHGRHVREALGLQ